MGQFQTETGTAGRGAEVKLAAKQASPATGQGQAEPHAATRRVSAATTAERTEDRPPLARRNARSAVFHLEEHLSRLARHPQPDARVLRLVTVLAGVVDEVPERLLQQLRIRLQHGLLGKSALQHQLLAGVVTAPLPG